MIDNIINKFNVFRRVVLIDRNTKKYIEFNKKKFPLNNKTKKGVVLVDFFPWNPFIFFWSILSNFLSNKYNLSIKFFYFPFYNLLSEKHFLFKRRLIKIYNSFNCEYGISSLNKKLSSRNQKKLIKIYNNFNNKDQLRKYKFKGILLGDLIHDTAIRTHQIPTIGLKDNRLVEKFLDAHLIFYCIEDYLKKNKVKFLIASDCVYNQFGIITRICVKKNIKNFFLYYLSRGMYEIKLATFDKKINSFKNPYYNYNKIFKKKITSQKDKNTALRLGKKMLISRLSGNIKSGIPYLDKSPFNSNKINNFELFDKKSYQNLILLHNFFDAPHKYRNFLYNDYLEWAAETIKNLMNTKINTYIKFHPIIIDKKADTEAKKVILKLVKNKDNFKVIDSKISYTDLIKNGLKSAVTCHGTAACELSYFGVKVLNCGDNPHVDYNFSIHSFSKKEYLRKLKNINKIKLNIDKKELYEFFYMHFYYLEHKDFKNKLSESFIIKDFKNKSNEFKAQYNNSSKYYNYIIQKDLNEGSINKIENYINEYFSKNL